MLSFLDANVKNSIFNLFSSVYEVRIRVNENIKISGFDGTKITTKEIPIKFTKSMIERTVFSLCNYSIYSVEESLKLGFITSVEGERVGVLGRCVLNNDNVVTIKDFSSLCIRIPHDVIGCSNGYFNTITEPKSCLVISKPFQGKTTFIRDLGRNYANKYNVLFVDERDELSANGSFYLGKNSDVLSYCTKKFGFFNGVRSYNPDVIVCDEIMTKEDCEGIEFALLSGVKVIASVHSNNIENISKKPYLSAILAKKCFDDLIVLNAFKPSVFKGDQCLNYSCV